jgi:hypothetical protein
MSINYATIDWRPDWNRFLNFEMGDFSELQNGETIASAGAWIVSPPGILTVGAPAISGSIIQAKVSGGVVGDTFFISAPFVTSGGEPLSWAGNLSFVQ